MSTFTASITKGARGNVLASGSPLAAGASVSFTFTVEHLGGILQVSGTGGASVSTTNGLKVEIFNRGGTTPDDDAAASTPFTIPMVASTPQGQSVRLEPGQYKVKFTNLDASNALADRWATLDYTDVTTAA